MDIGLHTSLLDTNSIADPEVIALASRITPLQAKEFGKVWDLFTVRATPFATDEYEILTRNYTAPEVTLGTVGSGTDWNDAADTTALPILSTTIDRLTIGDILKVDSEIVVVKSVDRTGNTIDVYERGAGESDASASHTTATVCKIIGNAHIEGTANAEALAEQTSKLSNYCQIIEEVVDLSKEDTDQARRVGMTADVLKGEAMERVMRDLARSAIYGVARVGTASIPASTRGLLQHLNLSTGIKTSVGGAFTETALKNILDDVRAAGGTINAIVLSVANKRIANGFTGADQTIVDKDNKLGGAVLEGYIADGFGSIPFVVDIDMPNDMVAVVNTRFMTKGWKVNDELKFVPYTNTNPREKKELLAGKFGFAVEGVGKTHGLLTNIS